VDSRAFIGEFGPCLCFDGAGRRHVAGCHLGAGGGVHVLCFDPDRRRWRGLGGGDDEAREESTACPGKRQWRTALGGQLRLEQSRAGLGPGGKGFRAKSQGCGRGKRKKTISHRIWKGWLRL
jgi:hypothetical protein